MRRLLAACLTGGALLLPLQAYAEPGVLRVGTSGDYAPFSLAAPGAPDGVDGFDVALARAYAEERGLSLELVRFAWPQLAADLAAGHFDVAMSGITVRPDRSLVGRFSVPLATSGAVALVREPTSVSNLDELDQRRYRIAVNAGGHLERVAHARFRRATLVSVPENDAVLRALESLSVDAVITDSLEAPLWEAQAGEVRRFGPFTRDRKAMLVRADRPGLAADLDRWLLARAADGSLGALRSRWIPGPPQPETATPLSALVAAMDERLALMPWVVAAKRRDVRPIADPARERRVIAAGIAAVAQAAASAGAEVPAEADVRAFFTAQIEAAKQVQLRAGRDPDFTPEQPVPALDGELRPALLRIGERIAALLVALPEDLREADLAAACRDGLRSPWLDAASRSALVRALYRVSARASSPATNGSATQVP